MVILPKVIFKQIYQILKLTLKKKFKPPKMQFQMSPYYERPIQEMHISLLNLD